MDLQKLNNPDQGQENMMEKFKEEIFTRNFQQMVQGPTRWGNYPAKIFNVKNVTRCTADHCHFHDLQTEWEHNNKTGD